MKILIKNLVLERQISKRFIGNMNISNAIFVRNQTKRLIICKVINRSKALI